MHRYSRRLLLVAALAVCLLAGTRAGMAHHMVVRLNLEEMTARADRIFVGQCVAVNPTFQAVAQGNLPVTVYTFEIERAMKGNLPKRITVTQLGHPGQRASGKNPQITIHGQAIDPKGLIHGVSQYSVGDRVLLFLAPNSPDSGMTQAVGLYQGSFTVTQMPSGQSVARNNINNLGLFTAPFTGTVMSRADAKVIFPELDNPVAEDQGLSAAGRQLAAKRGALSLEPLLEMVDRINVAHGHQRGAIQQ